MDQKHSFGNSVPVVLHIVIFREEGVRYLAIYYAVTCFNSSYLDTAVY